MTDRDMMYGGYYQNMPGSTSYGNFGYQGMPGSLMPNIQNDNNILIRLNNLENRIKLLEKKIMNNTYQDDNSLYML